MKILIVDDEELTRKGLIGTVDWESFGINQIYEAVDGQAGLKAAREYMPDIVLCDVRMPKMDGIQMLERIEQFHPNVVSVFMSGYSDKEYLKAAIQLKAINYIEKPIEPQELNDTLQKAVDQCHRLLIQSNANAISDSQTALQLAYYFTMPYGSCSGQVEELSKGFKIHYGANKFKYVTTLIVKLKKAPEKPDEITQIYDALHGFLLGMHLHVIYTEKRVYHIVFHVYGDMKPAGNTLQMVAEQLKSLFRPYGPFYIAIGDTVSGERNVYHSYESAVVYMQNSFFFEPGSVLDADRVENGHAVTATQLRQLVNSCNEAIRNLDEDAIAGFHRDLDQSFRDSTGILPNQMKSAYYDLFLSIYKARQQKQMALDMVLSDSENIMDLMENCFSFRELNELLVEHTKSFFADFRDNSSDNATIRLIREFINDNYSDSSLSVKSVSEYANLSVSYVCTYFKNETGTTLNQYITDYRMKKAKQLLTDPRYRVSEVSAAVGYNDGNYFAKSFRKATGLSPSEYREQVVRQ